MRKLLTPLLHGGLFLLTAFTTTFVGAEWITGRSWFVDLEWRDFWTGLPYSLAFLTFLTFHEFGHYFTARYHQVKTTLPFYIPFYIPGILNIGSFGAVIALRQQPSSTRKYFDIGIAGPLAGFVISVLLLVYGLTHLPDYQSHVLSIHPEYVEIFGGVPSEVEMEAYLEKTGMLSFTIGTNLLMEILIQVLPVDSSQVPSPFELMHYPFLFVGYITLFFTALNLLPMGQLDGGHITYGMFGRKVAGYISRVTLLFLLFRGGIGLWEIPSDWQAAALIAAYAGFLLYMIFRALPGWSLLGHFLLWAGIITAQIGVKLLQPDTAPELIWLIYSILVIRFIKLDHPPAYIEHRVNRPRQVLGWVAIVIFVLCFTPNPIQIAGSETAMIQQDGPASVAPANTAVPLDSLPVE